MVIRDATDFGTAIRKKRIALGYTQAQLAGFCGCSTVYLSRLENGKATAELGKALFIMKTLGIDLEAKPRNGDDL